MEAKNLKPLVAEPGMQEILRAGEIIHPFINATPVLSCSSFNALLDSTLLFKCENFQKAGSFKIRGASHALALLGNSVKTKGVCTHSSGNHAQALSLAAKMMGFKAHIVMPQNSANVKIEAVHSYGGKITFCNPTLQDRESALKKVQEKTGAILIHPFNDYSIIAGQATAALELIAEHNALDYIIAPVGGGGLLSGTILAAKYFSPYTKVIGAEPSQANDAFQSFHMKCLVPSVNPQTIADGLRTSLGALTWPIIKNGASDVLTASESTIVSAMKLIWERVKILVEPSGVLPFAVMLEHQSIFKGKKVGLIISGGNIDLNKIPWCEDQSNK